VKHAVVGLFWNLHKANLEVVKTQAAKCLCTRQVRVMMKSSENIQRHLSLGAYYLEARLQAHSLNYIIQGIDYLRNGHLHIFSYGTQVSEVVQDSECFSGFTMAWHVTRARAYMQHVMLRIRVLKEVRYIVPRYKEILFVALIHAKTRWQQDNVLMLFNPWRNKIDEPSQFSNNLCIQDPLCIIM
jgi:hypothetical protein